MKLKNIYIFILTISLFLLRYWDIIFKYKILGNGNDSVHLLGPVFKHTNDLMTSGQTPLWFQGIVGGVPFYNSAMFSFTYPFYFLGTINYGDGIDVLRTITLVIVFHFFLLFISNIVLLKVIGFDWLISIISSFSIILCLNTVYNSPWIIAIAGYALIPLFFAGIISMIKSKSNYLGVVLISIGSLAFLAKPAQTAILAIFFGVIITVVGLYINRKKLTIILPRFILAGVLILCINAPGLLQVFLEFSDMMRFTSLGAVEGNAAIPLGEYKSQVDFNETLDYLLFITKKVGVGHPWIGPIGVFSFFILLFQLLKREERFSWIIKTFFGITFLTILIAFGKELPTFWIHYHTPLLNKIRESSRFLFITNISITVLIAHLLFIIHKNWGDKNYLALALLGFSGLILSLQIYLSNYSILFSIGTLSILCLISYLIIKQNNQNLFYLGLFIILAIYSFILPNGIFGKLEKAGFNHPHNVACHNTLNKVSNQIKNVQDYRFMYHDTILKDGEWSNAGLFYNLRSLQGTIVVIPTLQYEKLWHSEKFLNYRLLWGCKYHLYNNELDQPNDPSYRKVLSTKKHTVYNHRDASARVYFAKRIKPFDGDWRAFRRMLEKQKKIKAICYADSITLGAYPELSQLADQTNNVIINSNYHDNKFEISTQQEENGLLVFNEYFSKNWKATLNNQPIDLVKINNSQMAIPTPSGDNLIELEYRPETSVWFRLIQKIAMLIVVFLGLLQLYLSLKNRFDFINKKQ